MIWQEQYQLLRQSLSAVHEADEAEAMAALVIEYVGKKKINQLKQEEVTLDEIHQIDRILQQLLTHRPLQYVLNEAWFYGLKFEVNESVLIPRPETEELVDLVVKEHQGHKGLHILDICAGSGCIPIALAANLNTEKVYGLEVSDGALEVANINAAKYNLPIRWLHQDVFEPVRSITPASLDVITSNPPYVLEEEQQQRLIQLPNLPSALVKAGQTPEDNEVVRSGGAMPALHANAQPHWDLIKKYSAVNRLDPYLVAALVAGLGLVGTQAAALPQITMARGSLGRAAVPPLVP